MKSLPNFILRLVILCLLGCKSEVPKDITSEKNLYKGEKFPVNSLMYDRYIIVKNLSEETVWEKLKEYGKLHESDSVVGYTYKSRIINQWLLLKIDSTLSFYTYHNLIGWFVDDINVKYGSVGIAINKIDKKESYIAFLDPSNSHGDTEVGFFDNQNQFFIYLPEAYENDGNMKIFDQKIFKEQTIKEFLSDLNFNIQDLEQDNIHYTNLVIPMFRIDN